MSNAQINPLICIPSCRDIPAVKKLWHEIPYDKWIEKYKLHWPAYVGIKKFFSENTQYTHMIIYADDLEVTPTDIEILLNDVKRSGYETISGYCNIDESQPDTYAIQPMGCDYSRDGPRVDKGAWYMKNEKPVLPTDKTIIEVGHSGFCCQIISRELFNKITIVGKNNEVRGNFDWQFSKECHKLGVPLLVDLRVKLWHRRKEQYDRVKEFKQDLKKQQEGYSFLLKCTT